MGVLLLRSLFESRSLTYHMCGRCCHFWWVSRSNLRAGQYSINSVLSTGAFAEWRFASVTLHCCGKLMRENAVTTNCRLSSYFEITYKTDNAAISILPFIPFRAERERHTDVRLNVLYVSIFWRSPWRCVRSQLNKQVHCTPYLIFCETKQTKMKQKEFRLFICNNKSESNDCTHSRSLNTWCRVIDYRVINIPSQWVCCHRFSIDIWHYVESQLFLQGRMCARWWWESLDPSTSNQNTKID